MPDKIKLQIFFIACAVVSVAALVAGTLKGDGVYLFLGGVGLLGVALLYFAVARRKNDSS
ncbi:hypothetical protein I3215_20785 [Streptomyces sp. RB110-1]|uniref:hypothetical protein n=1 Tax=unclassified Streptomyces TaxID=2593676 RepID=UPI001901BB64|nr:MULTISPECIES: hypothetical protein [unclassified Streptomyces]MBK0375304.1 hypothetical protein [Streptomyces sp. RB110-1]MBK0388322.1 hypothetical protein [Streptomyces sp. RB110-2]